MKMTKYFNQDIYANSVTEWRWREVGLLSSWASRDRWSHVSLSLDPTHIIHTDRVGNSTPFAQHATSINSIHLHTILHVLCALTTNLDYFGNQLLLVLPIFSWREHSPWEEEGSKKAWFRQIHLSHFQSRNKQYFVKFYEVAIYTSWWMLENGCSLFAHAHFEFD